MILLLAPDAAERSELAALLEQLGHEVTARAPGLLPPGTIERFDALVIDLAAGEDALRVLRRQAKQPARIPIVCIDDRRRPNASSQALRLGAIDIIRRPPQPDALAAALGNAREFSALAQPAAPRPAAPVDVAPSGFFGPSPIMRSVVQLARRIGPSRCPVLVVGEPGTGREVIARVIHDAGAPDGAPFVKLSCSAVTAAELRDVVTKTPSATIYLENLSELSVALQQKVERYIQSEAADAGADPASIPRFIAGAQPRLWSKVDRGEVRRELVDALSIVKIDLPPLRQRPEDIPLFAMHFLKQACAHHGIPLKSFTPSALTLLSALPWRGNASEVQSMCERLAVTVPRGMVMLEDVIANVRFEGAEAAGRSKETLKVARDRFERDHIAAALQHHKGRMGPTAEELGIERTNLYRKIKQLGVRWEGESD